MATKTAVSKTTTPAKPGIRVIKKGTCELIAPSSTGELTYNIGYFDKDKTFHVRAAGVYCFTGG